MRRALAEHLNSPQNPGGCLRGDLDDYLVSFEEQEQKLEAKLKKEREHLEQQVNGEDFSVKQTIAEFEERYTLL